MSADRPEPPESEPRDSHEEAEGEKLPMPHAEELPSVVEALLFAATQPLSLKRLGVLTGGVPEAELSDALDIVRERCEKRESGLMLMEVAGGFQLATKPEVADWVLALHKHRRKNPISPALMETLAIVAYKQPIVRAEVEAIRGVDCGGVMRALLDSGLVEVVGQKEVPGRPSLYGTTPAFLKTFGLRDLRELPSLKDLQSVLTASMKGKAEEVAEEPAEGGGEPAVDPGANGDSPSADGNE